MRFELSPSPVLLALPLAALLALPSPAPAAGPSTNAGRLTLERIFTSGDFDGEGGGSFKWSKDGHSTLSFEPAAGGSGRDLVRQDAASGRREILVPSRQLIPPGDPRPLAVEDYEFSDDGARLLIFTNSRRVWRVNSRGDYWLLDLTSHELKKLGGDATASTLMFAKLSPDGRRVCYVRANNLYTQDTGDLRITALTTNGTETTINGTFDWVYEEELFLRNGFRWSPDSGSIAYWQLDTTGVREFHLVNTTDGLYSRVTPIRYPKTGEQNAAARIGVVSADGGPTRWLDVPGDPREHYLARMDWAGGEIALQQFNRLQNTNLFLLADPARGATRTVLTEADAAWVENDNDFRWLKDGKSFVWISERDGWRQAYLVSRSGEKVSRITRGKWDLMTIEAIDEKGGWLYFLASPNDPIRQYLYRAPLEGGKSERVTPDGQAGTHSYNISPNAQWAFHTWSGFTNPPVTDLIHLPDHKPVRTIAGNEALQKKLALLAPCSSEFFRVKTGDGAELDGWCLKPPGFDGSRKYPVLFHVYGEPAGVTVQDRWKGKNHLWHWMLAQEGYVVMSVDNRGTPAPRGREWRRRVYGQVGILSSADQAAAVRAVTKRWSWVDPERVAIRGWSGGGSSTLNALFRYPDLYQTGMAVAPVPNQRFYDTIYQERYMGLPSGNAEGYRNGSPIHFAEQLKGNLLIVHGTGDDNCHYLGVETLIDELITHNKHFTMLAYPNRSHSINEGRNTTRHLFESLTRYLKAHTPP